MTEATDKNLLKSIQSGHIVHVGILYERYKRILWTYFYNNTKSTFQSEEMVQITFEKVLKYHQSYKGIGTVKSWIFSIARNVQSEQWNKRKEVSALESIEESEVDDNPLADSLIVKNQRKDLINRAMHQLEPDQRELLSMIKLQEMSYKEVAKLYDVNVGTLKVRLFRIITQLKEYMKDINAQEQY